jgi:hypothetical protein
VHVEVGPTQSSSALVWIDFAESVLRSDGPQRGPDVASDAVVAFATYLTEWRRLAEAAPEFVWSVEVPGEVAEYQVLAFYRIAEHLAAAAAERGYPFTPPEGQAFYITLVECLLEAFAAEGPGPSEFAEHLRSFWPGL